MTYKEKITGVRIDNTDDSAECDKLPVLVSKRNKRQIYLWDVNKEWYDGLKNKSRTLNLLMQQYRKSVE